MVSASGAADGASVEPVTVAAPTSASAGQVPTSTTVTASVTSGTTATVVAATGVAIFGNPTMADAIGDAMRRAVQQCLDEGIIDPSAQRERMLAARDAVLNT